MGRPINKRFIGDEVDSIKVTHYNRTVPNNGETAGEDDTHIVRQRSTNKFLISDTSGAWEEILVLVDKDAGTLSPGEFRIAGTSPDGDAVNITRLRNRTVRGGSGSTSENFKWSRDGTVVITAISTPSGPIVITAPNHGFDTGDIVVINDVVGTVELNGNDYVIVVTGPNEFELVGISGDDVTPYTSGGSVVKSGTIDLQES